MSKTILVVDDDNDTREMYAQLFANQGFKVIEARDGVEGLDVATSQDGIDVIFTGIIMPRMDGFQFISALKEHTMSSSIPVVINSHLGREEDRKKAFELGAKDFIIRGVTTPSEVVKRVLYQLNERSYLLKIDPFEMEAQQFIDDFKLNGKLICDNCGSDLALKLMTNREKNFKASVVCPNCKKTF